MRKLTDLTKEETARLERLLALRERYLNAGRMLPRELHFDDLAELFGTTQHEILNLKKTRTSWTTK